MNKEFEARANGNGNDKDAFFGTEDISLVDRLWLLYYNQDAGVLRQGDFLAQYPFHPENVEGIFAQEPELPLYLRESIQRDPETRRFRYYNGDRNSFLVSSWNSKRLDRAQKLRKQYIMEFLPLSLRVVYEGHQPHYWELQKCGNNIERVFQYIRGALFYHVIRASLFRYDLMLTPNDNASRYVGYFEDYVYPKDILSLDKKESPFELPLSDLIPDNEEPFGDETEHIQGVIYQKTDYQPEENDAIDLREAISRFQKTLDPASQAKFVSILEKLAGGESAGRKEDVLLRFQSYLRQSGFRSSQNDLLQEPLKSGKKLNGSTQLAKISLVYHERAYLLTPHEKKIIESFLSRTDGGEKTGESFQSLIDEVAQETNLTTQVVHAVFWRVNRILFNLGDHNSPRIIYHERLNRRQKFLGELIQKLTLEGCIPGFSNTESKILLFYHENPHLTQPEMATALKLGENTIWKAIKKLDLKIIPLG